MTGWPLMVTKQAVPGHEPLVFVQPCAKKVVPGVTGVPDKEVSFVYDDVADSAHAGLKDILIHLKAEGDVCFSSCH